jgi:outer membrane lipoprotein SlyB
MLSGGLYDLKSTQGDINVRISGGSGFTLTATAPRTRNISLGTLAQRGDFSFQGDNRRVVGRVGDGSATLNTTNLRGSIMFFTR